ncbi:hypothetical protein PSTT_16444, partial [Puccinia striiformis]
VGARVTSSSHSSSDTSYPCIHFTHQSIEHDSFIKARVEAPSKDLLQTTPLHSTIKKRDRWLTSISYQPTLTLSSPRHIPKPQVFFSTNPVARLDRVASSDYALSLTRQHAPRKPKNSSKSASHSTDSPGSGVQDHVSSSQAIPLCSVSDVDDSLTYQKCLYLYHSTACLVSYHSKNARRHLATCRYFACSNGLATFWEPWIRLMTTNQVVPTVFAPKKLERPISLHHPIVTIAIPTDPSSGVSPASSPKKFTSTRQRRTSVQSERASVCDGSPVQSSSRLTERAMPSGSTITLVRGREPERRPTIDPYDPSAKKIFSMPIEAINPVLRPIPPPASKCSSPVPPPPTRRLGTYELQRYRPELRSLKPRSSSTDTKPHYKEDEALSAALAKKTAQLEAVQHCYSALLKSFDDIAYSISQNKAAHELEEQVARSHSMTSTESWTNLSQDFVPDHVFLNDLSHDEYDHKKEHKKEENDDDGEEEDDDDECDDSEDDDEQTNETIRVLQGVRRKSVERSSPGFDAQELLTTDELSDQVRLKIASAESKTSPLADSPGNVFGRKRKRPSDTTEPSRPTRFIHKLADTTIDISDEIHAGLPSCCNFNKLIQAARTRIQTRIELRNQQFEST